MSTTESATSVERDWDTSLPDWADRLKAGLSLVPSLPLFDKVADKALGVFKRLRVPDMIGNPTYGEVCGPWVFDFVRAVFGCYDPDLKVRYIREFFLLVPKGNAKSTIAAAIIITAAILNERPNAELLLIAPTQKIAKIAYNQAAGIVRLDPDLSDLFKPRPHENSIENQASDVPSKILIKSADPAVVTGSLATFTLIDETHVFSGMSKAADVFAEIKGALGKRKDGFLLQITTQSKKPPAGVFKAELDIARDVRDGKLRRAMLPVLYELPIEMAIDGGWRDPATWGLVNPNLNRSISADYIAGEVEKAEREGPEALALVASQHLNVEIGLGLHADRWPGALYWERASAPQQTLELIMETCDVCTVGVDGGGLDDLFGLSVIGRHAKTKAWLHWVRVWAQPDVFERRKEIAPRLRDFERQGDLIVCKEPDQDIREAADIIERLFLAGLLPEKEGVGLDAFGVATLIDELSSRGIEAPLVCAVGQGWKLQRVILTLPRKIKDMTFRHCGQPIMAWAVGNAKVELKGSNYIVTKQAAGSAKIDPLMSAFDAAELMFLNPSRSRRDISGFLAEPVMAFG